MSNATLENVPEDEPDAAARIEALIDITKSLNAIFEEENAALEDRRPRDIAPLQPDKARLAAAYAQSIRFVAAERGKISAVGADLMVQLRATTETFQELAARQRALLDAKP